MQKVWISKANESKEVEVKSKSDALCVIRYSRHRLFRIPTQGQAVNQTVYKVTFRRLVRSVRDKRRSLWVTNAWALHHHNAPAHTALSICQFLAERNIATLEHLPYSPDGPM